MTVVAVSYCGREERVVGADGADLERIDGVGQAAQHQLAHRAQRVGALLERDEVLELVEVRVVDHREDPVAAVDPAARGVVVGDVGETSS